MAMEVGARELRTRAAEVLRAVQGGETVTVTYRGRPVAEIVPLGGPPPPAASHDAFGMWRDHSELSEVRRWVRESRRSRAAKSSSIPAS